MKKKSLVVYAILLIFLVSVAVKANVSAQKTDSLGMPIENDAPKMQWNIFKNMFNSGNIEEKHYEKDKGKYDYLTKDNKLRGVLFQIIPIYEFKDYTDEDLYDPTYKLANKIYAHAKFIHPYKLLMSEQEKEEWITKVKNQDLADIPNDLLQYYQIKPGYKIHKIVYWKLENARCLTIPKNSNFFSSHFYIYETMWQYKLYFSDMLNYEKKKHLLQFIKYCDKNKKIVLKEQQNILKGKYQGKLTINKVVMYYINTLYKYPLNDEHNKIIRDYCKKYIESL